MVRIWRNGDRNLERKLKKRKKSKDLCPICYPTGRQGLNGNEYEKVI